MADPAGITLDQALGSEPAAVDTSKTPIAADQPLPKGDKSIWGVYIFLCLVSIVELYSASSREVSMNSSFGVLGPVVRHLGLLIFGGGIVWFVQSRHYRLFVPFTYLFVLVSVCMMLYVMFFGEIVNGARRSMSLMGFQIQPAEFIKLSAVLVVSLTMARNQQSHGVGVTNRGVWISAVTVLFLGALLAKQGLTNTMLLMVVSLSMMLIGGVKFSKMLIVITAYVACGGLFYLYLNSESDHKKVETETIVHADGTVTTATREVASDNRSGTWQARVSRFLSGDSIPRYAQPINAKNRQEMYSFMAQANGGIHGVMPGNSREAARLPLAFSDFIYAIIIEDLGLIGGILVLLAYLCLLGRASGIASRCSRAYPALLVIGMAVLIVVQALVHMAIVTGVSPVSGQPLPLISKGGTQIIIISIAFGIMLSVSKYAVRNVSKKKEIQQEIDDLPEEIRSENPTQL